MREIKYLLNTQPIAHRGNFVSYKNYRITVMTERLFRVERSSNRHFCDKATQAVLFRDLGAVDFSVDILADAVLVDTRAVKLKICDDFSLSEVTFNGNTFRLSESKNLLGTYRTLDGFEGDECMCEASANHKGDHVELCDGVCAENGFAILDDGKSLIIDQKGNVLQREKDAFDKYVFVYGRDYRGALKDYYAMTGKVPMLPREVLGNWWSRYYAYTESSYLRLLERFKEDKIPLSVATIDMDWHYSDDVDKQKHITEQGLNDDYHGGNNGWTGFSWNKELFPDYVRFLKSVHDRGLAVSLNLHPADGIRWWEDTYRAFAESLGVDPETKVKLPFNAADKVYMRSYFDIVLSPYERNGVDIWWIDWQQGKVCDIENLDPLWLINHYHFLHTQKSGKLPVILSRYCGAGAHRYPLGFSGDTYISWKTLDYLPYFTANATNIGYTWWSHDIGGHFEGECDPELYIRFLQFGVFSPINRLHSTKNSVITKEPWFYKNGVCGIAEDFLRLRHKLVPLLYTAAYENTVEGQALIEPMYYGYDDERAFKYKNQYIFAKQMIVAPITEKAVGTFGKVKVWLPKGKWTDFFTGDEYSGDREFFAYRTLDTIPVFVKEGAIIPLADDDYVNGCPLPEKLTFRLYSGDGEYALYEDSAKGKAFTKLVMRRSENEIALSVSFEGDVEVIPDDRQITFVFVNVDGESANVYGDGALLAKNVSEDLSVTLPFALLMEKGKLTLIIKTSLRDRTNCVKDYCLKVITSAKGDNGNKEKIYKDIVSLKEESEIEKYILENKNIDKSLKNKLTEIIYG